MKKNKIKITGKLIDCAHDTFFVEHKTKIGKTINIQCYPSGKLRMHKIKLLPGDEVEVEVSPYDITKGRIMKRF